VAYSGVRKGVAGVLSQARRVDGCRRLMLRLREGTVRAEANEGRSAKAKPEAAYKPSGGLPGSDAKPSQLTNDHTRCVAHTRW